MKKVASEGKKPKRTSIRISRVVTRTGDSGMTSLVGGQRVPKDDPRLEAYGTSDELQAFLGMARDALAELLPAPPEKKKATRKTTRKKIPSPLFFALLDQNLIYIQNLLFTFNGELATRNADRWPGMPLIGAADVGYLEKLTEACNKPLPPLKDFIIPGGHPAITALHVCRVVARRAERELERLARGEPIGEFTRPFINRLSDVLFVLARRVGYELTRAGHPTRESIWTRDLTRPPLPE